MNSIDKISRDAKIFSDSTRDTLETNLVAFNRSGDLNLTDEQVSKILNILNLSVDQAYQKVLPHFQNSIKKHL